MNHSQMVMYEEWLLEKNKQISQLHYDNDKLIDDNTKLLDELDILQEKYDRLEIDMDNLEDDYTDQADVHTFETSEKDKEIESLKAMVKRMSGYAREDDVLIKAMERTIRRQLDEIDYLEKLSVGLHEGCDELERENTALKNTRDGLLTFSADEVEKLTGEVRDLKYMRKIDDQLFNILSQAWKRQLDRLAKFDDLRKDGTVDQLVIDAEILEEHGQYTAAEDIQRVVRIIKEDARK